MTTQAVHDREIDIRAAHSFGARSYDRAANDRCDIRCTTADVDNRRRMFIGDRNAGADRGSLTFFNHIDAAYACFFSSGEERSLLHLSHFGEHAHYCAAAEMRNA